MDEPKVLIAAPIGGTKQYSINDWFEWIAMQTYNNFDVCICINGKDADELISKFKQVEIYHQNTGITKMINILELKNSCQLSTIQKITYSREKIRRYASDNKYDYIFFLDTDTIPLRLNSISTLMKWGMDVISGVYFYKNTSQPVIIDKYTHTNISIKKLELAAISFKLIEVWGFGFGCLLIEKNVFMKNHFDYDLFGEERTDDFGYCHVLEQAGIKRYLDPDILCRHLDDPANEDIKKERGQTLFYFHKNYKD